MNLFLILGLVGAESVLQKNSETQSQATMEMWDFRKQDQIGQLNDWLTKHEKRETNWKTKLDHKSKNSQDINSFLVQQHAFQRLEDQREFLRNQHERDKMKRQQEKLAVKHEEEEQKKQKEIIVNKLNDKVQDLIQNEQVEDAIKKQQKTKKLNKIINNVINFDQGEFQNLGQRKVVNQGKKKNVIHNTVKKATDVLKKGHHQVEVPVEEGLEKINGVGGLSQAKSKDHVIVNEVSGTPVLYVKDPVPVAPKQVKHKQTHKKVRKEHSKKIDPLESIDSEFEDPVQRIATVVRSERPEPSAEVESRRKSIDDVKHEVSERPVPLGTEQPRRVHPTPFGSKRLPNRKVIPLSISGSESYSEDDDGFPEQSPILKHSKNRRDDGPIRVDERLKKIPIDEIRQIAKEHPDTESIRIRSQGSGLPPIADVTSKNERTKEKERPDKVVEEEPAKIDKLERSEEKATTVKCEERKPAPSIVKIIKECAPEDIARASADAVAQYKKAQPPVIVPKCKSDVEKKIDDFDSKLSKMDKNAMEIRIAAASEPNSISPDLQDKIDKFRFLREQVLQTSGEIEAKIAALEHKPVVTRSAMNGRWDIINANIKKKAKESTISVPTVVIVPPSTPVETKVTVVSEAVGVSDKTNSEVVEMAKIAADKAWEAKAKFKDTPPPDAPSKTDSKTVNIGSAPKESIMAVKEAPNKGTEIFSPKKVEPKKIAPAATEVQVKKIEEPEPKMPSPEVAKKDKLDTPKVFDDEPIGPPVWGSNQLIKKEKPSAPKVIEIEAPVKVEPEVEASKKEEEKPDPGFTKEAIAAKRLQSAEKQMEASKVEADDIAELEHLKKQSQRPVMPVKANEIPIEAASQSMDEAKPVKVEPVKAEQKAAKPSDAAKIGAIEKREQKPTKAEPAQEKVEAKSDKTEPAKEKEDAKLAKVEPVKKKLEVPVSAPISPSISEPKKTVEPKEEKIEPKKVEEPIEVVHSDPYMPKSGNTDELESDQEQPVKVDESLEGQAAGGQSNPGKEAQHNVTGPVEVNKETPQAPKEKADRENEQQIGPTQGQIELAVSDRKSNQTSMETKKVSKELQIQNASRKSDEQIDEELRNASFDEQMMEMM